MPKTMLSNKSYRKIKRMYEGPALGYIYPFVGNLLAYAGPATIVYGMVKGDANIVLGGAGIGFLGNQMKYNNLKANVQIGNAKLDLLEKEVKDESNQEVMSLLKDIKENQEKV